MSDRHQPREIGRKESGSLQQHVHVARLLFRFDCHFVRGIAPMPALPPRAVELLAGLPRLPGNPWVIPGSKPGTHLRQIDDAWRTVRVRAGLHDVRIHDLRHSFASRALSLGECLPIIGKLLGHARIETTSRYAHLARESVRMAAERVAESIAADILGKD